MPVPELIKHAVVLDVNIYLDVADLLGPPFSWRAFDAAAAQHGQDPLPCRADGRVDSLRAVAVCQSGRFAGQNPLEVWTSAHIDGLVRKKARERLGWSSTQAQRLVDQLVHGSITESNGGTLGLLLPYGYPPLDYEDGVVYATCHKAADPDDVLIERFCVTRDRGFVQAFRERRLPGYSRVVTPAAFVAVVREARRRYSIGRIRGPGRGSS